MAKMYTLDKKLLCGVPEIRIGEKVYPVDDRKNTVKKAIKLFDKDTEADKSMEALDELFVLAFGEKNAKEIEALDLSFKAFQELSELVLAAMTGEEPEEIAQKKKGESFRRE